MTLTERIHEYYAEYEERDRSFLQTRVTELVPVLQQFNAGEYYKKSYPVKMSILVMQQFLDSLKEAGLDIGKGDSTFGYKMPIPEKRAEFRDLIIFRRR